MDVGATITGRLQEKSISLRIKEAASDWDDTYDEFCLNADLAAALGNDKLRSMIVLLLCCFRKLSAQQRCWTSLPPVKAARATSVTCIFHPSFAAIYKYVSGASSCTII